MKRKDFIELMCLFLKYNRKNIKKSNGVFTNYTVFHCKNEISFHFSFDNEEGILTESVYDHPYYGYEPCKKLYAKGISKRINTVSVNWKKFKNTQCSLCNNLEVIDWTTIMCNKCKDIRTFLKHNGCRGFEQRWTKYTNVNISHE